MSKRNNSISNKVARSDADGTQMATLLVGSSLLEEISKGVVSVVYRKFRSEKVSVFLCGKALDSKKSMRSVFAKELLTGFRNHMITLMFPEDIFEELLAGSESHDLLSLENLLAGAVDVVVVILESPGAIAELGAFSNHTQISKKMVIVQDERYRREKSFINIGPVQFLRKKRKTSIVYYNENDTAKAVDKLRKTILSMSSEKSRRLPDSLNLLNIDTFLLPCLFLLDSPNRETLQQLVMIATEGKDPIAASIAVTAGLSVLRRKGLLRDVPLGFDFRHAKIRRAESGVQLTQKGVNQFLQRNRRGRWKYFFNPPAT